VVGGVGGYGNCLGIPNLAGDIFFDPAYSGNPLVNAMCVGIAARDDLMRAKASGVGNLVLLVGADTGRDGIHGATFASVDDPEKSHRGVVQVGNPFLEKLLLEACLEVLQTEHVVAMQDLGAAGLTSSAVECASRGEVGIEIDVALVSRRESGMSAYEVMLSESQERMLVVVTQEGLDEVRAVFDRWSLHSDVIGRVTADGLIRVLDDGHLAAEIPATLLTDECPTYTREGVESPATVELRAFDPHVLPDLGVGDAPSPHDALLRLLASPNIASRTPVTRTYDSTIMTNTVIGPGQGDAGVVRIKGTERGLAMKTDCNPRYCFLDPYLGGLHAIAEAARNIACVGGEIVAITNCLNFGNPERREIYFQLKRAIEGIAAGCRAFDAPVISGNVSLYNQSGSAAILPTPTIGAVGILDDVRLHARSAFRDGRTVFLIGSLGSTLGGSEYLAHIQGRTAGSPPSIDVDLERAVQEMTRRAIRQQFVVAAHDCSDGGIAIALAESCIGGKVGGRFDLSSISAHNDDRVDQTLFGEAASRVLLQAEIGREGEIEALCAESNVPIVKLGKTSGSTFALERILEVSLSAIEDAWSSTMV
jgi:phosphoribosylformylglycinamidine synthase